MYIAYSAFNEQQTAKTKHRNNKQTANQITPQQQGYLAACAKYSHEIAAIQQYIPGWLPSPPAW